MIVVYILASVLLQFLLQFDEPNSQTKLLHISPLPKKLHGPCNKYRTGLWCDKYLQDNEPHIVVALLRDKLHVRAAEGRAMARV
jgi:hypothetical protein